MKRQSDRERVLLWPVTSHIVAHGASQEETQTWPVLAYIAQQGTPCMQCNAASGFWMRNARLSGHRTAYCRPLQTTAQPQRQQRGLLTMRCLLDSRIIGAAVTARRLLCWHRSPWSPPFTQRTYYISHTCPHTANPMNWDRRDVPDAGDSADRRASAAADTGSTISGPYFWSLCSTSRPSVFRMTTGALSSSVTCTWSFPKNSRRKEWPGLIVFPMMHAWLVSNV